MIIIALKIFHWIHKVRLSFMKPNWVLENMLIGIENSMIHQKPIKKILNAKYNQHKDI